MLEKIFLILLYMEKNKFNFNKKSCFRFIFWSWFIRNRMFIKKCRKSHFCRKRSKCIRNIKENINYLKITDRANIISQSTEDYIKNFNNDKKFDLIFLDPPYKDNSFRYYQSY